MATFRRPDALLWGSCWKTQLMEQSSSGFVLRQCRCLCNHPRNSLPCPLTSNYLSARSATRGRSILIVDLLTSLGFLRPSLGFVGRLFAGVFDVAPGVLNLAFRLFHGSVGFLVLVARPLPGLTFNPSSYVLNLAFNLILFITPLLLLGLRCSARQINSGAERR